MDLIQIFVKKVTSFTMLFFIINPNFRHAFVIFLDLTH